MKIKNILNTFLQAYNHRNDKSLSYIQGYKYWNVRPSVDNLKEVLHFGWSEDSIPELDSQPNGYYMMAVGHNIGRCVQLYCVLKDEDGYSTNMFNPWDDPWMNIDILNAAIAFCIRSVGLNKFLCLNKEFAYIEHRRAAVKASNAVHRTPSIRLIEEWAKLECDTEEERRKYTEMATVMMNHY